MNNSILKWSFIAVGFSLLVNIVLFSLLPLCTKRGLSRNDLEIIIPVNVIRFKRPDIRQPEDKKEPPEKKWTKKIIPTVRLNPHKRVISKKLEMAMPLLSFDINPKLTGGMTVALPQKDSYLPGEVDRMPVPITNIKPVYPIRARRLNITGEVEVKFLVDERGNVANIEILKSIPVGIFDNSVFKTLPSWRFSPGKVCGKNVSTWVITTIKFRLEGQEAEI